MRLPGLRIPAGTMRTRIVATTALVSAIAMAAMVGAVVLVVMVLTDHDISTALDNQLAAASATLRFDPSGRVTELSTPDDEIDETTWVFDRDGNQVVGPTVGERTQSTAESLARSRTRTSIDSDDRVYLAGPVRNEATGAMGAVVVVSASRQPYESGRAALLAGLAVLGLVVTVGAAAIAAWTIRRALMPVESMATLAQDWSEHDLESRFEGAGRDEISQLGETLNVLLDRVAGAIRREQQLTSELAHELRTPLTAIRGEAELGLLGDPDERLTRVLELADRMSGTINALLAVARGHDQDGTRCEISAVIGTVLADLPAGRVPIDADASDLMLAAPLDLAVRALAPLVGNAVEHAGCAVTITSRAVGRVAEISVSDDGAGLASAESEELFTAGVRGETSRGAGLGLALSRRVARTLDGDVRVTSASQPTTFTLFLPRF